VALLFLGRRSTPTLALRMNVMKSSTRLSLALVIALAISAPSQAQNTPLLDDAADVTCAGFLAPLLGRKEISQLTVERSIDSKVVCSCTKQRMREDSRLTQMYAMSKPQIEEALRDQKVFAYALGRIMQSVIACFSIELDATLNASPALR
jgi:hypothetical protein